MNHVLLPAWDTMRKVLQQQAVDEVIYMTAAQLHTCSTGQLLCGTIARRCLGADTA